MDQPTTFAMSLSADALRRSTSLPDICILFAHCALQNAFRFVNKRQWSCRDMRFLRNQICTFTWTKAFKRSNPSISRNMFAENCMFSFKNAVCLQGVLLYLNKAAAILIIHFIWTCNISSIGYRVVCSEFELACLKTNTLGLKWPEAVCSEFEHAYLKQMQWECRNQSQMLQTEVGSCHRDPTCQK
jgi:hypothetical protein